MITFSIWATCPGVAEMRRAPVARSPSWSTAMTMSRAVRPATAPYSLGPRTLAHTIWNV